MSCCITNTSPRNLYSLRPRCAIVNEDSHCEARHRRARMSCCCCRLLLFVVVAATLGPAVSRKFPQSRAKSRKFQQFWTCGTCGTICGTLTRAIRTSHDSTKKEKVGDFESARPHYRFFQSTKQGSSGGLVEWWGRQSSRFLRNRYSFS
jgi:hypothetical protein